MKWCCQNMDGYPLGTCIMQPKPVGIAKNIRNTHTITQVTQRLSTVATATKVLSICSIGSISISRLWSFDISPSTWPRQLSLLSRLKGWPSSHVCQRHESAEQLCHVLPQSSPLTAPLWSPHLSGPAPLPARNRIHLFHFTNRSKNDHLCASRPRIYRLCEPRHQLQASKHILFFQNGLKMRMKNWHQWNECCILTHVIKKLKSNATARSCHSYCWLIGC